MMRPNVNPVVPVATGVFTHSLFTSPVVTGVVLEAYDGTAVPPALSPCHALLNPTSPSARSATLMTILPPRLGTSCHMIPLILLLSAGLTIEKLATYWA